MSLKSLGRMATAKVGRHMLTLQQHSPGILVSVGVVGVTASVVLASRATLKLTDVLRQGEEALKNVDPSTAPDSEEEEARKKATFGVKLKVAIDVAKLYAPSALFGIAGVSMIAGSHLILKRRNAGLAAAYTVLDKSYKNYRKRVVDDQGAEKDFEYFHGVEEREIIVDGKNGPETKKVKGLDQESIESEDPESFYRRVFNEKNPNWNPVGNENQMFLNFIQSQANDLLRMQGHVFLNEVYDLLGFDPTEAGQIVGWVKNPRLDSKTNEPTGDGYIDFGVWNEGIYEGKQWLNGNKDAQLLEFNVDGPILYALAKQKESRAA